ncbi:MAG: hypothetical protein ABI158_09295 [Edaphobacter sp.]
MTYQGERARPITVKNASELGRCFEVSKIRLDADGHVSDVLWTEMNTASNQAAYAAIVSPAAALVDAIHDGSQVAAVFSALEVHLPRRLFVIFEHEDGREYLVLDGPPVPGRNLPDMPGLDAGSGLSSPGRPKGHTAVRAGFLMNTFAVSKVGLDADGRVTQVKWGRVDTRKNAWATPEVVAPVSEAMNALNAGDQVFALFPSINGHLPDRQFVIADYGGGLKTIVLDGPTAYERNIHDMDRIDPERTGP